MTDDGLVEFLRACYSEDERTARLAMKATGVDDWTDLVLGLKVDDADIDVATPHIGRNDPARVLRRVEAGRAILARYEDCLSRMEDRDYPAGVARDQAREYEDFVLPNLAAEFSDRPGYREEWKP